MCVFAALWASKGVAGFMRTRERVSKGDAGFKVADGCLSSGATGFTGPPLVRSCLLDGLMLTEPPLALQGLASG